MQSELNYKLQIEPMLHAVLEQIAVDAIAFGAKTDEVTRAVDSWLTKRLEDNLNE